MPLASLEIHAQCTKYSIDNGPIKNPRYWRSARGKYERADNALKRKELRIRKRQKQQEADGRKEMIKRHLANQPAEHRDRFKRELEAKPINYPEKENKQKAPKKKRTKC